MRSGGEKSRRVSSSVTSSSSSRIDNLSDELLICISNYLPKTNVALLASVFSSLNNSEPSARGKSIISSFARRSWECIDFLDVDKDLRIMKLTDNDIQGLLFCIDAVNNLKKLKLTHCFNFTGMGLQQLSNSVVLEQIDLSLVGQNESPNIEKETKISEAATLPILNNIIGHLLSNLLARIFSVDSIEHW